MLNPYLASVGSDFNPTGSCALPLFQDDMVLRAAQLNTQFGFLTAQDQASRHQLAGVGVATGLQPLVSSSGPFSITITAGSGVTTDGDLLHLPARTYAWYTTFEPRAEYAPFSGVPTTDWLELATTAGPMTQPNSLINDLVSSAGIGSYVVVLYYEARKQDADSCTGVACDQAGAEFLRTVRVLLVPEGAIPALLHEGHQQAANAAAQLPVLALPRLALPAGGFYKDALTTGYASLRTMATNFATALTGAYARINQVDGIGTIGGGSQLDTWIARLNSNLTSYGQGLNQQYCYAWLKDLYEAYEEFRQATAQWMVAGPATVGAFPQHLVLGKPAVDDGEPLKRFTHRHGWLRAADGENDARPRALWLLRRLGYLIEGFSPPADATAISAGSMMPGEDVVENSEALLPTASKAPTTSTMGDTVSLNGLLTASTLRFTPDYGRTASFDRRSLPFYYHQNTIQDTRRYWSYAKAATGRSQEVLSYYRAESGAAAHLINPFNYQVENFDFYRVEGLQGLGIGTALQQVAALRNSYNLAFDVVAVRHDAKQPSIINNAGQYADLAADFAREQTKLRDMVIANNAQFDYQQQVQSAPQASIVVNDPIPTLLRQINYLSPSYLALTDILDAVALETIADAFKNQWQPKALPAPYLTQLQVVKGVWLQYQARVAQLQALTTQLTLPTLLAQNPGLERGAGVPRGGTLVLVYSTQTKDAGAGSTAPSIVVADYYLPYRLLSTTNAPVQFLLGELPQVPDPGPLTPDPGPLIPEPDPEPEPEPEPEDLSVKNISAEVIEEGQKLVLTIVFKASPVLSTIWWHFGDDAPWERLNLSGDSEDKIIHTYLLDARAEPLVTVLAANAPDGPPFKVIDLNLEQLASEQGR